MKLFRSGVYTLLGNAKDALFDLMDAVLSCSTPKLRKMVITVRSPNFEGLSQETISLLGGIYKQSNYQQVRQRAHCIMSSYEGYQIQSLMKIFQVSRLTIYKWFNDWKNQGLVGLYDKKGRVRKPKLNPEQKQQLKEWALQHPKNLNELTKKIREAWKISVSKDTIKRVLKSLQMSWHRIIRGVA